MTNISTKRVYSPEGSFEYLELIQGENVIKLSLASTELETRKDPNKWDNLRRVIDNHQQSIQRELQKTITDRIHEALK